MKYQNNDMVLICLAVILSCFTLAIAEYYHLTHKELVNTKRPVKIFYPEKSRDYGSLEKGCLKLLKRLKDKRDKEGK